MSQTQRLWAPWRLAYVATTDEPTSHGCFLCRCRDAPAEEDRENLIVVRGTRTLTVLNRFPYNNGHLLVARTLTRPVWRISTTRNFSKSLTK